MLLYNSIYTICCILYALCEVWHILPHRFYKICSFFLTKKRYPITLFCIIILHREKFCWFSVYQSFICGYICHTVNSILFYAFIFLLLLSFLGGCFMSTLLTAIQDINGAISNVVWGPLCWRCWLVPAYCFLLAWAFPNSPSSLMSWKIPSVACSLVSTVPLTNRALVRSRL